MLVLGSPLWVLQLLALLPAGLWGCLQCDEKFKEEMAKLRTGLVPRQIHDSRLKARAEALLKGLEGDFLSHYATSQFAGYAVKTTVDGLLEEVKSMIETLSRSTLTDQALLDELVDFRKKTTMKLKVALKEHQTKACDKATCGKFKELYCRGIPRSHLEAGIPSIALWLLSSSSSVADWLRYSVLDCVGCKDINAVCYTIRQCFVDSQDRLSLRYGPVRWDPNITQNGVAIVLCMGGLLFVVIIGVIIKYWRNYLYLYV
ncbi:izumo sperm-egg fusion protein 2 [Paroedura picta]|uniref:izumo sperm-egg fusion protein 2 n=1 Tax=Paroedura picta TaxID=143630 RepID=UPI0040571C3B